MRPRTPTCSSSRTLRFLLPLLLSALASASDVLVGEASNFDQLVAAHEFALVEL